MGGVCSAENGGDDVAGKEALHYESMKNKTLIKLEDLAGVWYSSDGSRVEVEGNRVSFLIDEVTSEFELVEERTKFTLVDGAFTLMKDSLPYIRWEADPEESNLEPVTFWRRTHLTNQVLVDFTPGRPGFTYKPQSCFHVKKVLSKGQAVDKVEAGWFLLKAGGHAVSEEVIAQCMEGVEDYQMEFLAYDYKTRDTMSFTSNGQNVVLVLEKGVLYRYENGQKMVGTDKKGKITKLLVGKNGELFDQSGYSGVDCDFDTLLKLKAWCHIARIPNNIVTQEQARYRRIDTGSAGFSVNFKTGVVQSVDEGGQFEEAGVKNGWKILMLNEHEYSEKELRKCLKGKASFLTAFEEVDVEDDSQQVIPEHDEEEEEN